MSNASYGLVMNILIQFQLGSNILFVMFFFSKNQYPWCVT